MELATQGPDTTITGLWMRYDEIIAETVQRSAKEKKFQKMMKKGVAS